jgi:hypothetical protein
MNSYIDTTSILTNQGFKLFSNLYNIDKIAQYHEDGNIDFIPLSGLTSADYHGDIINFYTDGYRYFDLFVTPSTKMVGFSPKRGVVYFRASSTENNFSQRTCGIISGKSTRKSNSFSDLDRLKIAFQADGSFASHKEDYDGTRSGGIPIRFSLKKDRKKKRLEFILNNLNFKYAKANEKGREGYNRYWISATNGFLKDFSWVDLDKISHEWGLIAPMMK